jgi:hypothetical protein
MANTYTLIASSAIGSGGASSITFSSIPNTYTDLQLLLSLRGSGNTATVGLNLYYNSNTSNYTYRRIDGSGSSLDSSAGSVPSTAILQGGNSTANTFGNYSIYIANYAGSTNKPSSSNAVNENNGGQEYATLSSTLWSNTSAITSIELSPSSGTILQYSTAYLYGIKNS